MEDVVYSEQLIQLALQFGAVVDTNSLHKALEYKDNANLLLDKYDNITEKDVLLALQTKNENIILPLIAKKPESCFREKVLTTTIDNQDVNSVSCIVKKRKEIIAGSLISKAKLYGNNEITSDTKLVITKYIIW